MNHGRLDEDPKKDNKGGNRRKGEGQDRQDCNLRREGTKTRDTETDNNNNPALRPYTSYIVLCAQILRCNHETRRLAECRPRGSFMQRTRFVKVELALLFTAGQT